MFFFRISEPYDSKTFDTGQEVYKAWSQSCWKTCDDAKAQAFAM